MPIPLVAIGASAFWASVIGTLAFRLFAALGIGIATYQGMEVLVVNVSTYIQTKFGEINAIFPALFDLIVYLKVDQGMSMIFASVVAVTAIQPLKWVKK